MNKCLAGRTRCPLLYRRLKMLSIHSLQGFRTHFGSIGYYLLYYYTYSICEWLLCVINCKHTANRDIKFNCRFHSFIRFNGRWSRTHIYSILLDVGGREERWWWKTEKIKMKEITPNHYEIIAFFTRCDCRFIDASVASTIDLPTNQRVKYFP